MVNKIYLKFKKNTVQYLYRITKSIEMLSVSRFKILYNKLCFLEKNNNFLLNLVNKKIFLNNYDHFLLEKKVNFNLINNIMYIIISSDQGLCGNLNFNLFKKIFIHINKNNFFNKKIYLFLIGKKSFIILNKFKEYGINYYLLNKMFSINKVFNNINKNVTYNIINFFKKKVCDKVYIANNIFINNIKFYSNIERLLPIKLLYNKKINYLYENDKFIILNDLFIEYINFKIFYAILNNMVSENSLRMLITKNASQNSEHLFKNLNLLYNKLRQFIITKEIIELASNLDNI